MRHVWEYTSWDHYIPKTKSLFLTVTLRFGKKLRQQTRLAERVANASQEDCSLCCSSKTIKNNGKHYKTEESLREQPQKFRREREKTPPTLWVQR